MINSIKHTPWTLCVLGEVPDKLKVGTPKNVIFLGWFLRKYLPKAISKCKIGIIPSDTIDSCPRVIPEFLACDIPVAVAETVNFWRTKYVVPETGLNFTRSISGVQQAIQTMMLDLKNEKWRYAPRKYYDKNLSMSVAAKYLANLIKRRVLKQ